LAPVVGTVSLGRRDSHADQGAVATQFSNSTETGTSPILVVVLVINLIGDWLRDALDPRVERGI